MHCYELGEMGSDESRAVAAAIEAGAPREEVVRASIAMLEAMARAARHD